MGSTKSAIAEQIGIGDCSNRRALNSRAEVRYIVLICILTISHVAQASWTVNGRDALLSMYLPQAKKPDTHAVLIVSYEKRWSCRPAISVLLFSGLKLGTPERQVQSKKAADQLHVLVDGKEFTGETKTTFYSNGVERAMFAQHGLVEALKQRPRSVQVRLGAGLGEFDFSDGTGFQAANAAASANCS